METTMKQLKNWLKTSAIEIRLRRNIFKEHQRKLYCSYGWNTKEGSEYTDNVSNLYKLRKEYRHKHIAYSELRGKTRDQIEASYPYTNQTSYQKPDEDWIKSIKLNIKFNNISNLCVAERRGGEF